MKNNSLDFKEYRKNLASELVSNPDKRKDILAQAQNNPEYYISKYSKREGKQLTLEETYSILFDIDGIKHKYDNFLIEDSENSPLKLIIRYRTLLNSKNEKERNLIESELVEQLPKINELYQNNLSRLLFLKNMYSNFRARVVVSERFRDSLRSELDKLINLIREYQESGKDTNKLIDEFHNIWKKLSDVEDSFLESSILLDETPKLIDSLNQTCKELSSIITSVNKNITPETEKNFISILDRIDFEDVPDDYVSVYHTTYSDAVKSIDNNGLLTTKQIKNQAAQAYIDRYRKSVNPKYQGDVENISRANCIYAFLDKDEYKNQFGGRSDGGLITLELKVDPKNCYIIDFELSTRTLLVALTQNSPYNLSASSFTIDSFRDYWSQVVSLTDYLEYYENGLLKEGAPDGFPDYIENPEVIITKNVPQSHIRKVEGE